MTYAESFERWEKLRDCLRLVENSPAYVAGEVWASVAARLLRHEVIEALQFAVTLKNLKEAE